MVYKCSVCGYLFDEEKEGKSFSELTECPLCKQPVEKLEPVLPGSLTLPFKPHNTQILYLSLLLAYFFVKFEKIIRASLR